MSIIECEVPAASVLDRRLIEDAFFHDAYRAPLIRAPVGVVDVFFAIFGHHPTWMKIILVLRNGLMSRFGLAVPTTAEIMRPQVKPRYHVGDRIGPWPIFHLSETEIVAGRDNHHLDFRLSILKEQDGGRSTAVVSTVCTTHNAFGKFYLILVTPFHSWGVRWLMTRALTQGRL